MAEKIRRAERFSVRTRRTGADMPPVLQIRTVPSCGKDPARREIFRQNKACAQMYRLYFKSAQCRHAERSGAPRDFPPEQGARAQMYRVYFKSAQCRHAEKIRRTERFSARTRRAGADVPCVLQARTVPSCGKDPARREIFRQNKARGRRRTGCTSSPRNAVMAEKIRRGQETPRG